MFVIHHTPFTSCPLRSPNSNPTTKANPKFSISLSRATVVFVATHPEGQVWLVMSRLELRFPALCISKALRKGLETIKGPRGDLCVLLRWDDDGEYWCWARRWDGSFAYLVAWHHCLQASFLAYHPIRQRLDVCCL